METICHHLLNARNRKNKTAVEFVKNRKWKSISWTQYFDHIEKLACGLKTLGVEPGDKVIIFSNTRVEWAMADLAILGIGAVTVPIYQSSIPEEILFIVQNSEAKTIIFESLDVYKRYKKVSSEIHSVQNCIGMTFSNEEVKSWEEIMDAGEKYRQEHLHFFEQSCLDTDSEKLATIVYTSGTTGTPKGVCIHHEQIISEISEIFNFIDIDESDKTLTFLPFAHVVGRVEHFCHVRTGFTMAYPESIEKISANLRVASPTFMVAVPRIFEKIYTGILSQTETSPMKKKIFQWAIDVGYKISDSKVKKKTPPLKTLLEYQAAKKLVFDNLAKKLGGRLRFAISGGAPLNGEIARFFHAANLLILEGYGLTETTAAITLNTPFGYKFGTVGKPLDDVKIKIASDGEICVHSKKVMRGYFKNEEATKDVFDEEGYFKTGDIGEIDAENFLKITDRKKDLIKTAGGKYVAPQKLENLLKLDKNISNVLIHGDRQKYIVSLITLNEPQIKNFAKSEQIPFGGFEELSQHPKVKDLIRNAVAQANTQLASFETIKNFAILPHDFTIESGELTPSLKVKRKFCDQKYEAQIRSLYGE
jgi:long-chain acyl-CoA synthetase